MSLTACDERLTIALCLDLSLSLGGGDGALVEETLVVGAVGGELLLLCRVLGFGPLVNLILE